MTERIKTYPQNEKPGLFRAFREYGRSMTYGERFWFYKFRHSSPAPNKVLRHLYQWWDRVRKPGQSASLAHVLDQQQLREVRAALMKLEEEILFAEKGRSSYSPRYLKRVMTYFRSRLQHPTHSKQEDPISLYQQPWR